MHRIMSRVLAGLALVVATVSPVSAGEDNLALVHLRTVHDGSTHEGTGVVVASDRASGVMHVLTAATLFRRADGEPAGDPVEVTAGTQRVVVSADQVLRPLGEMTGVALLRVRGFTTPMEGIPIDYLDPAVGSVFVIAGVEGAKRIDIPERAQFVATRLVVGDSYARGTAGLPGCARPVRAWRLRRGDRLRGRPRAGSRSVVHGARVPVPPPRRRAVRARRTSAALHRDRATARRSPDDCGMRCGQCRRGGRALSVGAEREAGGCHSVIPECEFRAPGRRGRAEAGRPDRPPAVHDGWRPSAAL